MKERRNLHRLLHFCALSWVLAFLWAPVLFGHEGYAGLVILIVEVILCGFATAGWITALVHSIRSRVKGQPTQSVDGLLWLIVFPLASMWYIPKHFPVKTNKAERPTKDCTLSTEGAPSVEK